MMDSTGGRLAVRRRRRVMGSGWQWAEQPLSSRWPATQLRDCVTATWWGSVF